MTGNMSFDQAVRAVIVNELAKMGPQQVQIISDHKVKELHEVVHEAFDEVLKFASLRLNIMLIGPMGCGKSFLAGSVARALDLEYGAITCTAGMSESQLMGWLLPIGDSGSFNYVPAPFVNKYENGGLYLLDELDAGDSNTTMILNTAIAGDQMEIPQRVGNEQAKKHQDFVCIAACNTFGTGADIQYVGRNQLDAAFLDRFKSGTVVMDYSARIESRIIDEEILEWGREMREKIGNAKLQRAVSTRLLKDYSALKLRYDYTINDIKRSFFLGWSEDEKARVGEG